MAFWEKIHKESMSDARKQGKVLQMVTVMAHEDRKAMLERDHEERMAMIQKLPKIILSKLENKVERLRLAINKDEFAHLETYNKKILVKSQKMIDAECACRRRVY
ncbi:hypothetical protein CTI12_AA073130 [Artemisia annua]|uniref:Uncharacterized protein n=1 Tax=Artemisia annua TaxID=35608 RepID=A0A2U1Q5E8_ARTAN|nr:hypothetical protein CTI12_AA073130 [Artemisia annua]